MDEKTILSLANWSVPAEIITKFGPRILRKAAPTEAFWKAWRAEKDAMKALGAGCSRNDRTGEWELCWWKQIDAAELERRKLAVEQSRAASAEIDLPHPEGWDYLPFQRAGIRYALERTGVLIGDDMGLGKTVQAIGIINADPEITSALVVCPKSLVLNWRNELTRWLVRPMAIGIADPSADICIINYEGLNKHLEALMKREWGAMIVDEAHYIKNRKTSRSQNVKAIAFHARRNIRLTGTPIVNRPIELFNIINDLHPAWKNWNQYAKRYCGWSIGYGGHPDVNGHSNLDELQTRLRETIMVRRLKKDVLTELPAKIRQIVEVEATGDSAEALKRERAFESASDERLEALRAAVELSKADSETAYQAAVERLREASELAFTELSKLRHDTALAKIPAVVEHVRAILENEPEKKVIIGFHHHDVGDTLANSLLDFHPVMLTGETKIEDRQKFAERFQADASCRVFLGSILAAGVGLTLTAADWVVLAELDWVPGNMTQFEDRAHRIGQANTVLIQHIVLADSLDARMARMLVAKQKVIDDALDTRHAERQYEAHKPAETRAARDHVEYQPRQAASTHDTSPDDLGKLADKLTEAQRQAAHRACQFLAGNDADRAQQQNGIGFNKIDGHVGHDLANRESLSPKAGALAWKLARKYRGQLPAGILEALEIGE